MGFHPLQERPLRYFHEDVEQNPNSQYRCWAYLLLYALVAPFLLCSVEFREMDPPGLITQLPMSPGFQLVVANGKHWREAAGLRKRLQMPLPQSISVWMTSPVVVKSTLWLPRGLCRSGFSRWHWCVVSSHTISSICPGSGGSRLMFQVSGWSYSPFFGILDLLLPM